MPVSSASVGGASVVPAAGGGGADTAALGSGRLPQNVVPSCEKLGCNRLFLLFFLQALHTQGHATRCFGLLSR